MPRAIPTTSTLMAASAAALIAFSAPARAQTEPNAEAIVSNYADIALAGYGDSLAAAEALESAVTGFLAKPSQEGFEAAKAAWLAARPPYQQTEAYRFGNPVVDDWEGRVNAWPLDEGLIDYVDPGYGMESDENTLYTANVIANPSIEINGETVDASSLTPEFLSSTLQEAGDIEANVATGYHAIEFLLWGQDLNGTGPGAGKRPWTDYDTANCTNDHCDRRAQYLASAATLLVSDLKEMVADWESGGAARKMLADEDPKAGLAAMLTGMGSLSYGELAGQRMKVGLLLHDPEEEHDCFSDNTHESYYFNAIGIRNVYLGAYQRLDGSKVEGASLSQLVSAKDPSLDQEMRQKLDASVARMQDIRDRVAAGEAYDQLIGEGNEAGNATVQAAIDALIDQTQTIEKIIAALELGNIELEGSDSLDNPEAVFK